MDTQKVVISVKVDNNREVASVSTFFNKVEDVALGMTGNFWDFHPECYGMNEVGDFNCLAGFVNAIELKLTKEGHVVEIIRDDNWNYSEDD